MVKIDIDRMTHGKEVVRRIGFSDRSGLPWMVILDAEGKNLITADGPKGNVGFPVEPQEIEHFIGMLQKTAKKLTPEQISEIEKALKESARRIKEKAG